MFSIILFLLIYYAIISYYAIYIETRYEWDIYYPPTYQ
jgi:hypothetical protein